MTILYSNPSYTVSVGEGNEYVVVNRQTDIIEVKTTVLPNAIFAAAQLHDALVKQPWTWFEKQDEGAKPSEVLM